LYWKTSSSKTSFSTISFSKTNFSSTTRTFSQTSFSNTSFSNTSFSKTSFRKLVSAKPVSAKLVSAELISANREQFQQDRLVYLLLLLHATLLSTRGRRACIIFKAYFTTSVPHLCLAGVQFSCSSNLPELGELSAAITALSAQLSDLAFVSPHQSNQSNLLAVSCHCHMGREIIQLPEHIFVCNQSVSKTSGACARVVCVVYFRTSFASRHLD
jgi:hypothetical protein